MKAETDNIDIATPKHTTDKLSKYRESRILAGEENLLRE